MEIGLANTGGLRALALNRTIVGWKCFITCGPARGGFSFKSHHSGMEMIRRQLIERAGPALNRTIVGWKSPRPTGSPNRADSPLNRTIVGWKLAKYRAGDEEITALNRTIVGWKYDLVAFALSQPEPLNRTIVGWKWGDTSPPRPRRRHL